MNTNSASTALTLAPYRVESGIELFANNPHPRVPVVCLLDTSASMAGQNIRELEEAVATFYSEIARDPLASLRVDPSIYGFGGGVRLLAPFGEGIVDASSAPRQLVAAGDTPLGAGIRTSLASIRQRQQQYRAEGVPQYRPWIFLCSDGYPTDDWEASAAELCELSKSGWTVLPVGIGPQADMQALGRCSTTAALRLSTADFKAFFRWLSTSLKAESRSATSESRKGGLPDFLGSIPVS